MIAPKRQLSIPGPWVTALGIMPALLVGTALAQTCPDQHDPGGPVSCEWLDYVAIFSSTTHINAAVVDLEGNIVITGWSDAFPSGSNSTKILVAKFDITSDGGSCCDNPPLWISEYADPTDEGNEVGQAVAVDYDSNIYVCGELTSSEGNVNGSAAVLRYGPNGGSPQFARLISQPFDGPLEGRVRSIAVDPEGIIYAAGREAIGGDSQWFVARLSAFNLDTQWVTRFDSTDADYGVGRPNDLIIDRRGNPHVTGEMTFDGDQYGVTMRLDPNSGDVVWMVTDDDDAIVGADEFNAMASDLDCNIYVTGVSDDDESGANSKYRTIKYDADGAELWSKNYHPTSNPHFATDIAVDLDGNVYVTGDSNGKARTVKYTPDGTQEWVKTCDECAGAVAIALDFLGNPYIATDSDDLVDDGFAVKYDRNDPNEDEMVWKVDLQGLPVGITVDAGGGVFLASNEDDTVAAQFFSQPAASVPQTSKATPNFQLEAESVWDPSLPSFFYDYQFYSDGWDKEFTLGEIESGFGGKFKVKTDGRFKLSFRAEASLGSFDATFPGTATVTIHNAEKLSLGSTMDISTAWELDPCARISSNGSPTVDAGIVAELTGQTGDKVDAEASIELEAFGETIVDTTIFDVAFNVAETYIISVAQLLFGEIASGRWIDFEDEEGIFEGQVRYPRLSASGSPNANGVLKSDVSELFFTLRGNVTTLLMLLAGKENSVSAESTYFDVEATFFELFLRGDLSMVQELALEMQEQDDSGFKTPLVTLEFRDSDGTLFATRTVNLGEDIADVDVPSSGDGIVEITPIVSTDAQFSNYTGLKAIPVIGFETIVAGGAAHYEDVELGSWDKCFLCDEEKLGKLEIELYDRDWSIGFPEYKLAPISVVADIMTVLTASSQARSTMLLYDQINPQQSSFNADVNDSVQMLLYGDGFTEDTSQATICFHGRAENIDTTWLNNNTLLVAIPNRFKLLAGTARIFVTTDLGQSNSIDYFIEYPSPNLATVNPNLWAADPELATIPVSVIDGFTPAGNHTYIARRDYYIKLRDDLWNSSTAGGIDAETYFPDFDFDATPAFPLVSFDGVAMPRFVQPVDNGIHNIRLPESAYASPGVVPVFVANPVPGGGLSNVIDLTIAAPRPVVSSLEPSSLSPTRVAINDDFESGEGDWTHYVISGFDSDGWALSTDESVSGIHSWYSGPAPSDAVETALESPDIDLTAFSEAVLAFEHIVDFNESCPFGEHHDGGIVEVLPLGETDPQWTQIFPVEGYDYVILDDVQKGCGSPSALGGLEAFTGSWSGFRRATFNLGEYAGQIIRIRFRAAWDCADCGKSIGEGWYIDDVRILSRSDITLIVNGPSNVPTWQGFEEPKFGNFTASSVVKWNGLALPTTFVNSSVLLAELGADAITDYGSYPVTVFTPDNGSQYFEQLMIDPDGDGETEVFWQGNVPSGCTVIEVVGNEPVLECESNPIIFTSTYPDPVITDVSPPTLFVCSAAFDDSGETNVSVKGNAFAPGAIVNIDGLLRNTFWVSENLLQVELLSSDVEEAGTLEVTVLNPLPSGGQSSVSEVPVDVEDCNANGLSDQCEIADGDTEDCNENSVPDSCDIIDGTSDDADTNGIPDECEGAFRVVRNGFRTPSGDVDNKRRGRTTRR